MKFFKTLLASTLGVIIGLAFITVFGIFILSAIASSSSSSNYKLVDNTVLKLDLKGSLSERNTPSPTDALFGVSSLGLNDVVEAINKAKDNDKIKGIYIKADEFYAGIASLEPIRKALIEFKTKDKFIVSYADNYSQSTYYISSVADKIIMNPKGTVSFQGLATTVQFVKNQNDKLGIKFQVFKVGTFKSAVEPYIQNKMSEPNRLQTSSYINDIWGHMLKGISESRKISTEDLNKYADEFLMLTEPKTVVEYGMVDTLMYETSVDSYLKSKINLAEKDKLKLASVKNIIDVPSTGKKDYSNKIAVLYAEGAIMDKKMGVVGAGGSIITPEVYVKELKKLKEDDKVKAVVFRVSSPGGSAYASEQIWNAVKELQETKPVIVSMGDYAASGGYYISCAADVIVAEPTTLTGSIGIFGLLPNGEELAEKMGYTFDEVKTNKNSAFGGRAFGIPFLVTALSRGLTEGETKMFQNYIERGYDLFITRCADGRSKTKEQIDSIGQGRVWTGSQALEIGLVDKIGGLEDAIKVAVEKAGLETYSLASYPLKKDFFTQMLESTANNSKVRLVKAIVGEDEYNQHKLQEQFKAFDACMALMPETVIH